MYRVNVLRFLLLMLNQQYNVLYMSYLYTNKCNIELIVFIVACKLDWENARDRLVRQAKSNRRMEFYLWSTILIESHTTVAPSRKRGLDILYPRTRIL